jgi:hypothetical protein
MTNETAAGSTRVAISIPDARLHQQAARQQDDRSSPSRSAASASDRRAGREFVESAAGDMAANRIRRTTSAAGAGRGPGADRRWPHGRDATAMARPPRIFYDAGWPVVPRG